MRLYHYSHSPDLFEIDPKFYGQNKNITPEYKQGHKHLIPRSYFYTEDKPEGVVASGRHKYTAELPQDFKIYDLSKDPEQIVSAMHQKTGMVGRGLHDEIEHEINRKGYHGYQIPDHPSLPHVMVLFHKLPISKAEVELKKNDSDNISTKYNSQGGLDPANEEEMKRAKDSDLITLPPDTEGTNCRNCKFYVKKSENLGYCNNESVLQNVTPHQCCKWWDRDGSLRPWIKVKE